MLINYEKSFKNRLSKVKVILFNTILQKLTMENIQELDINSHFVAIAEIRSEGGKKNVAPLDVYSTSDLNAQSGLKELVEYNVSSLWNANERHARNVKPSVVTIRSSLQKVGKSITADILGFKKERGANLIYRELLNCENKNDFLEKSKELCEIFKDTSYAPQVLISVVCFSMGANKFLGFFTHSLHRTYIIPENKEEKIRMVKKALKGNFQKGFVFPYFEQKTKVLDQNRAKLRDQNYNKADYVPEFIGLEKQFDPNDVLHELSKNNAVSLEEIVNKIKKEGDYEHCAYINLADGGVYIKTNIKSFRRRFRFTKDGKNSFVQIQLNSPSLRDNKKGDITHLIEYG